MKNLIFIALLFLASPTWSQTTVNGRVQTGTFAGKPATCNNGDQYNATDTSQVLICQSNAWVIQPTLSGANPWTGNETHAGTETFSNINGTIYVDCVVYSCSPDIGVGVNAALTALPSLGGQINLPCGTYLWTSTFTISKPGITISGCGTLGGTILNLTSSAIDGIKVQAGTFAFRNCSITLTLGSSRSAFSIFNLQNTSAVRPTFENLQIDGDNSGNNYNGGNIWFASGSLSSFTPGWTVDNVFISGFWNTGFDIGSSGGGTITTANVQNLITLPNANFAVAEILLDTGVDTFKVSNSQLWNGTAGGTAPVIWCRNTLGSQAPRYITFVNTTIENHNASSTTWGTGIQLDAVQAFDYSHSPLLGQSLVAVQIGTAAIGINIDDNYIQSVQNSAITASTGAVLLNISGNHFQDVGIATNNTYPVISIGAGVSRFTVSLNHFAKNLATNLPSTDVTVASGASTDYTIIGNNFGTQGTDYAAAQPVSNSGSGTQQIGFNTPPSTAQIISGNAIPILTALTTTASTSDNVTVTGMTSSGHCWLLPTNASAATNIATTYVSAKTTNQITVTHTATSGMTYDIGCTPN